MNRSMYSACVFGPGAVGSTSLFTVPDGSPIQTLGQIASGCSPIQSRWHTTLNKAGELGAAIGDITIDSLEVEFVGGSLVDVDRIVHGTAFELVIAGRSIASGSLC